MIFDLDGVLVHSMPLHTLAWERYLEKLGVTVKDLEARMHGKPNPELVREFLDPNASDEIAIEHGGAKEWLFRKLMRESGFAQFAIPGLIEFLERYRDVPKAIGSNAEPASIDFTLDHFGLRDERMMMRGSVARRHSEYPLHPGQPSAPTAHSTDA